MTGGLIYSKKKKSFQQPFVSLLQITRVLKMTFHFRGIYHFRLFSTRTTINTIFHNKWVKAVLQSDWINAKVQGLIFCHNKLLEFICSLPNMEILIVKFRILLLPQFKCANWKDLKKIHFQFICDLWPVHKQFTVQGGHNNIKIAIKVKLHFWFCMAASVSKSIFNTHFPKRPFCFEDGC